MADSAIRVVECTAGHIGMMSKLIRDADRREVVALYGEDVRRAIRRFFHMSVVRRAGFIDGELAAIWGISSTLLSDEAMGWLLTTPQIEKKPLAFVKETQRQLSDLMQTYSVIRGHVAIDYKQAVDFLMLIGFSLSIPRPMGDGTMFREALFRKEWIWWHSPQ